MQRRFSLAAITAAALFGLPAGAMPSKFVDLENSTFCSIDQGHSVVLIDDSGSTSVRGGQSACITLNKVEDLWKVRIDWWSKEMNKRFVEYALAGWINPKTLAYKEAPSQSTSSKIVGEGHIRFIDNNTVNFFQYGVLENGHTAMFSENLTRANGVPEVNIPLQN